jgi:hypothetical protein
MFKWKAVRRRRDILHPCFIVENSVLFNFSLEICVVPFLDYKLSFHFISHIFQSSDSHVCDGDLFLEILIFTSSVDPVPSVCIITFRNVSKENINLDNFVKRSDTRTKILLCLVCH